MPGYTVNITGDSEVYHIYIKGECVYHNLNERPEPHDRIYEKTCILHDI